MVDISEYMSPKDAAAYLGIRAETVRNAIRNGNLAATKVPGNDRALLILRSDVEAYKERTRPDGEKPTGRPAGSKDNRPRRRSGGEGSEAGN